MGRLVIHNLGIGSDLMQILLDMLEEELNEVKLSPAKGKSLCLEPGSSNCM